jgi:glycosyltransferase A (GT-A) superfamily protein (DUF2064 family)
MSDDKPCLVVFCRKPRRGVGKQRLAAAIGQDAASEVAAALWDCVREDLAGWRGDAVLAVTEPGEEAWAVAELASLAAGMGGANNGSRRQVLVQPAGNLGERLMAVDASLRGAGRERLIFIGSDAPALSAALLDGIAAMLQHADVVLAPADDGGVVAMAARTAWPPLADLPWSSELLARALQDRCRAAGQGVSMTNGSYDVDDLAGLGRVATQLRDDSRPARRRLAALAARLAMRGAP